MKLIVFPTSRALRSYQENILNKDSFLPKLLTIEEFEKKAIFVKNRVLVDEDTRLILLKNAANFEDFKKLGFSEEFFSFIKNSSYFFRFFDELSLEGVNISELKKYDVYEEFYEHLEILEKLYERYLKELNKNRFYDKTILPKIYEINENFIREFDKIEIYLEGFLTRFEIELFFNISKKNLLNVYFKTNRYNLKMQERFYEYGFEKFEQDSYYELNFSKKVAKKIKDLPKDFDISYLSVSDRMLQIFFIKKKIYDFIKSGIKPENIAILLPDENFKDSLNLFDEINNLNFAMGMDFENSRFFKGLNLFLEILSKDHIKYLYETKRFDIKNILDKWYEKRFEKIDFETFEELIRDFYIFIEENQKDIVEEELKDFKYIYQFLDQYSLKKRLQFFLNRLKNKKIEDSGGGKITVIGPLESRGVSFDGVIVVDFNEDIVPKPSQKDIFLNSYIRKKSSLPTKKDRENLQKYYYFELFRNAKKVAISFVENDTQSKSRFLEELEVKKDSFSEDEIKKLFIKDFNKKFKDEEIVLEYDFKREKLSPSRLRDFLECKRRYFYKYIKKLKPFEIPSIMPMENEIGNILHKIFFKLIKIKIVIKI